MTPTAMGFSDQGRTAWGPIWLSTDEVRAVHARHVARFGGSTSLRDLVALEAILGRIHAKWDFEGADLATLAAAHAFGIVRGRPFETGNRRTAFLAMMLFLRKNGSRFAPPRTDVTRIVRDLAEGRIAEADLAQWIRGGEPIS